jgi:hypothetical protein
MQTQQFNPVAGIDLNSYFAPPKQGNTTTFTPHQENNQPVAPAVKPEYDPKAIADGIFGELPAPVKNQASQDRIKRIQKVNALGEGLSALGDIFSLSQGANVKRRQPDGSNERLQALFERREDDYDRRMDEHNRQQFNTKIQGLIYGTQRADRAKDLEDRDRVQTFNETLRQDQLNSQEEYRKEQIRVRDDDRKVRETAETRQQKQFEASHALALAEHKARMEALKNPSEKDKKPFNIYSSDGKGAIQLEDFNEAMKVARLIIDDPKLDKSVTQSDLDLLSPTMGEQMSNNAVNSIIQKYWEHSPAVQKYIEGKRGGQPATQQHSNSYLQGLGVRPTTGNNPTTTTQPVKQTQTTQQPVQQAQVPSNRGLSPQQALNKQVQEDIILTPEQIVNHWQSQGYDIVNEKPYQIAQKLADKENIPEKDRPKWIAQVSIKIQKEKDLIDTSQNMKNLNYDSRAGKEIPASKLNVFDF